MTSPMRAPQTTAEFCLSAGEVLTVWHLDASGSGAAIHDPQCLEAAYLVAAAVRSTAADRGLEGADVVAVRLDQLLVAIEQRPVSALESLPSSELQDLPVAAFTSIGDRLLGAYGTEAFDQVQQRAAAVVRHHQDDGGDPAATIADRSPVVSVLLRQQQMERIADAMGWDED
jgi:hypothetical protein